ENRVGATGSIAAAQIAKSKPDGYKLLFQNGATFGHAVLTQNPQYDVLKDFTPIAYMSVSPQTLVVGPALPVENVQALAKRAQAEPSRITFGSEGIGGSAHLASEFFAEMKDLKLTHVPYKSAVYSTTAVASGEIDMTFATLT